MRVPCDARVSAVPTASATVERALSAVEDCWSDIGRAPLPQILERVRTAIKGRWAHGGHGSHWQSLLDDALADLDYSADWDGQRVRSITLWGAPPVAVDRHQTVPFGYLNAQPATMDDESIRSM